ncbi:hypothetical protein BXZ70DRAFT_1080350 [Cristinia sonorae]|uniref:Uncharacterized protein n=1 Tax=Cristinia sonorae TaxID=1940300 RepID=A0A8K0UFB5_9AGAR|nr:hypothetical protein BXZ70DRAFT_1080350 [Cristinia sonorae]
MPRGEKGGTSAKPVQIQCASRATAHHTSKLPQTALSSHRQPSAPTDSPRTWRKQTEGQKAQRPEGSSNSLRRGYHTVERGGEVSINWMMRKGKVLSRAVKRKYKEKKQDRNSVK